MLKSKERSYPAKEEAIQHAKKQRKKLSAKGKSMLKQPKHMAKAPSNRHTKAHSNNPQEILKQPVEAQIAFRNNLKKHRSSLPKQLGGTEKYSEEAWKKSVKAA
ncbi:hypothetical protein L1987_33458 [Smallanthus sonchifolius]|uniref:Uncharacterized protein n=1 Tax=Smallanthus sonchifolius TaxID=185202 RepID=A0ACB9HQL0_9ASTR|nr:hypothetical protein L1987_33458 [Smallanthus sonchifolius]